MSTVSDHFKIHFSRISRLNFVMDAIQLSPEPVLGGCIKHLGTDAGGGRSPDHVIQTSHFRTFIVKQQLFIQTKTIRRTFLRTNDGNFFIFANDVNQN